MTWAEAFATILTTLWVSLAAMSIAKSAFDKGNKNDKDLQDVQPELKS